MTAFSFPLMLFFCVFPQQLFSSESATLRISPSITTVGEPVTVELTITAPDGGIAVGGNIHFPFYLKPWAGLERGLTEDMTGNTLVSASRSDGGAVEAVNVERHPVWAILSDLKVYVRETPLPAGESITLRFGDETHQLRTRRKQRQLVVEAAIDAAGDEQYTPVSPPDIRVKAQSPARLLLVAPSYAGVGTPVDIVAYAEDGMENVCEAYTGRLTISARSEDNTTESSYRMRAWDQAKDLDRNTFSLTFPATGVYYIHATDPASGLTAVSNPVRVMDGAPRDRLVWGEIHVHSQVSDGCGELDDLYRDAYARGLDFLAIADHGFGRNTRGSLRERLDHLCAEVARFHREGEFVTIPAGEAGGFPKTHMNIYFLKNDAGLIETVMGRLNGLRVHRNWQSLSRQELQARGARYWNILKSPEYRTSILAFPHHTMWQGITAFIDDARMRIIELHSVHGCSEIRDPNTIPAPLRMSESRLQMNVPHNYSVREALNEGHRLGFVGGSDNHGGQPGMNAITAARVPALTRKALFESLYARRCYATSANRTLIEWSADDTEMGQILKAGDVTFHCFVAGDGTIDTIEIIGNGRTVYTHNHNGQQVTEFDWTPATEQPGYYYVRVLLNDGTDGAWSSPIWIEE